MEVCAHPDSWLLSRERLMLMLLKHRGCSAIHRGCSSGLSIGVAQQFSASKIHRVVGINVVDINLIVVNSLSTVVDIKFTWKLIPETFTMLLGFPSAHQGAAGHKTAQHGCEHR